MPAGFLFSIRSKFSQFGKRCCVNCFTKLKVNAFCRCCENSSALNSFSSYTTISKHLTQIYTCKAKLNQCYISSDSELECLDRGRFEDLCDETLDSLCEVFEQLLENCSQLKSGDVTYGIEMLMCPGQDGVLTVKLGVQLGTYVINRQSPNKQIWLSSPSSGPKRYDFVPDRHTWVYRHTGEPLHRLLEREIAAILSNLQEPYKVQFTQCAHYGN